MTHESKEALLDQMRKISEAKSDKEKESILLNLENDHEKVLKRDHTK